MSIWPWNWFNKKLALVGNVFWPKIFINAKNKLMNQVLIAHFGMRDYAFSKEKLANFSWPNVKSSIHKVNLIRLDRIDTTYNIKQ